MDHLRRILLTTKISGAWKGSLIFRKLGRRATVVAILNWTMRSFRSWIKTTFLMRVILMGPALVLWMSMMRYVV